MSEEIDDALRGYAGRVQSFGDQFQKWNEVEVKEFLIKPLLATLSWDTTDPNFVRHEFPVTMGSETRKVDYALMSGDTPICVVEAKAGELDDAAARQALSYAHNLDVPWVLVTNGRRLCLYGDKFYTPKNAISNALVMDIEISPDSIDESLDSLKYLANGTLDSEEVYNVFKAFNERRALLVFLQSNKNILVKEVIAKWIEEQWDKGSVNEESLIASLESVFGKIEKKHIERPPPTTRTTVAGDWEYRSDLGKGIFEFKDDSTKRIDVSSSGPDVERQLENLGLRTSTRGAFGGFYWNLRREAGLIRRR